MALAFGNSDTVLGTSATTIFTGPSPGSAVITAALATNTDTSAHTITLYRVPPTGSAGSTNIIAADALSIPAGASVPLLLAGQSLFNAQILQGLASTGSVVIVSVSWGVFT